MSLLQVRWQLTARVVAIRGINKSAEMHHHTTNTAIDGRMTIAETVATAGAATITVRAIAATMMAVVPAIAGVTMAIAMATTEDMTVAVMRHVVMATTAAMTVVTTVAVVIAEAMTPGAMLAGAMAVWAMAVGRSGRGLFMDCPLIVAGDMASLPRRSSSLCRHIAAGAMLADIAAIRSPTAIAATPATAAIAGFAVTNRY